MADPAVRRTSASGTDQSIGDLVSVAARDISQLVRYELDLAKLELKADVKRVGIGGALIVIAAVRGVPGADAAVLRVAYGLHAAGLPGAVGVLPASSRSPAAAHRRRRPHRLADGAQADRHEQDQAQPGGRGCRCCAAGSPGCPGQGPGKSRLAMTARGNAIHLPQRALVPPVGQRQRDPVSRRRERRRPARAAAARLPGVLVDLAAAAQLAEPGGVPCRCP